MSTLREKVVGLAARGFSPNAIARELGVAEPTVRYHLERNAKPKPPPAETVAKPVPAQIRTREQVARLLGEGLSKSEVARRLGVTKGTVSYHAQRLGEPVDERGARRYDWVAVQAYYDGGRSVRDCCRHFGFSRQTWHQAAARGAVRGRPHTLPLDELLVAGTYRSRHNVKARLLSSGAKQPRCEVCGLSEWREEPLSLALHHVNGDRNDNRLENLQLLCPNCHSQTDTYSGRNGHRRRAA